jgi:FMN phosphatase YigB (HAD superfamily)
MKPDVQVIFFDIGDTLAIASFDQDRLVLAPLPGVASKLSALRDAGLALGIISNTGDLTADTMRQALEDSGLYTFFAASPDLLIYSSVVGMEKDSPKIFKLACERAGLKDTPGRCMFVGENSQERAYAMQAGFRVASAPAEIG